MKVLCYLKNNQLVQKYALEKDQYTIGRSKDNDLVFDHPKVSRIHARIFRENGNYLIQDLNSTNYVFVNGVRVKQKQLEPNDRIQISSEVLLIYGEETATDNRGHTVMDTHQHFASKRELLRLRKIIQSMVSLDTLEAVLTHILQEGLSLIGAERGFIVLTDGQAQILWKYATTYGIDRQKAEQGKADISHSILRDALQTQKTVVRLHAEAAETGNCSDSMLSQQIYAAICTPLLLRERVIGLLYADAKERTSHFTPVDQFLFDYLADHATLAIVHAKRFADLQTEIQQLQGQLAQKQDAPQASSPPSVAREALSLQQPVETPQPTPIQHTYSAGGVVLNRQGALLIVNQKGTSWSLPKGRLHSGEEPAVAAQREIYEETGVAFLRLLQPLPSYQRTALNAAGEENIHEVKSIYMYLFYTDQEQLSPRDPDNPEARWVLLEEALQLLTHPKDQKYLQRILPILEQQRTALQTQNTTPGA